MMSNLAINPIRAMKRTALDVERSMKGQAPLTYAFRNAKAQNAYRSTIQGLTGDELSKAQKEFEFGPGSWNYKRIAGTAAAAYMAGDSLYRGASGGSWYRNSTGNSDIMGVPLI